MHLQEKKIATEAHVLYMGLIRAENNSDTM